MKQKAAFLVVAFALFVAIVMSGSFHVNSAVTAVRANLNSINSFLADGGGPIPPFPPSGKQLITNTPAFLADGGGPIPPFPPSGGQLDTSSPVLSADGGGPIPPFPPSGSGPSII
ncbi:MAG TPA: hypothetical protein VKB26_03590 [Candidatus Acidoferrales bacterium]|nr:hypothetical protein [Candidatus Acidoferrales bacterium]